MKINVKYYPDDKPITVQFGYMDGDEFISEFCNHAGATEKVSRMTRYNYYTEDIDTIYDKILVCDKCEEIIEEDY